MKFLILLLLYACSPNKSNLWRLELELQGQKLPVVVKLTQKENILYNSDEKIDLTLTGQNFQIGAHYSQFQFVDKNKGIWIRTNKEDYSIPFRMIPIDEADLFKQYEQKKCSLDLDGNWKTQLPNKKFGLAIFKQRGCRVKSTILTETGDYRFLDGYLEKNRLYLQGFDGVFAFIFKLNINDSKFSGIMYAGKSFTGEIKGKKDERFKLADASSMTQILKHKAVTLKQKDIDGNLIDISASNKPKVIQLFGSWCPNCHDETRFLNQWIKNNPQLGNEINLIALAFENFKTKKEAIKALKKSKQKLKINYPIILADFDKSLKVQDLLPIDDVRAYPTTLFLNKENKLIKVHTGFSGPATGPFYDQFIINFTKTIKNLVK
jgi:thiol-disulfide isomerase/thioredoxin